MSNYSFLRRVGRMSPQMAPTAIRKTPHTTAFEPSAITAPSLSPKPLSPEPKMTSLWLVIVTTPQAIQGPAKNILAHRTRPSFFLPVLGVVMSSCLQTPPRPAQAASFSVRLLSQRIPASMPPLYCGYRGGLKRCFTPQSSRNCSVAWEMDGGDGGTMGALDSAIHSCALRPSAEGCALQ